MENTDIKKRVIEIFFEIGVDPALLGYIYLKDAVCMAYRDPDMIRQVTKKLYPSIAEKNNTTAMRAERSMRHAIERCFADIPEEVSYRYFGNCVSHVRGKLWTSTFIAVIVEHLKKEFGEEESA